MTGFEWVIVMIGTLATAGVWVWSVSVIRATGSSYESDSTNASILVSVLLGFAIIATYVLTYDGASGAYKFVLFPVGIFALAPSLIAGAVAQYDAWLAVKRTKRDQGHVLSV